MLVPSRPGQVQLCSSSRKPQLLTFSVMFAGMGRCTAISNELTPHKAMR